MPSPAEPAVEVPATLPGLQSLAELPDWLDAAVRPERALAALLRAAPGLTGEVVGFESDRVRMRDDSGTWLASYDLHLAGGGTVSLVGGLSRPDGGGRAPPAGTPGPPDWRIEVPELGLELSAAPPESLEAVPVLTDADRARPLLESAIRAGGQYPDLRIDRCTAEIMRFKPGSRCTVRYRLESDGDGATGPDVVVAKTYHGSKGENAFDAMRALWSTPLADGDVVNLAEPLAYLPDEHILVQGPVPEETTLKDLVRDTFTAGDRDGLAVLATELEKTADGLAALHRSEAWHGEVWTLDDEVDEVREQVERLAAVFPDRVAGSEALLDLVAAHGRATPADPVRPAHLSFRPAQVLLHGGRIGFIDFDGFGKAEPALDIALFLATVRSVALQAAPPERELELATVLDELAGGFVQRYVAAAPVSVERVQLWEALHLLTKVLHCWTKVRPRRLRFSLLLLERHLRATGLT